MDYSNFEPFVNQNFEASPPDEPSQTLVLVRIDTLPPPPQGYAEIRQQPFEMIFRSFTTSALPDGLLTLKTPEGSDYLLTLQPEYLYSSDDDKQEGIQYRCIIA